MLLDENKFPFRTGLDKLIKDCNDNNSSLTFLGRLCLRKTFIRMISNNLKIADRIKKSPEILLEEIKSPVFIVGPPRTGSSHLHDTMARHSVFRTPKHMELVNPVMDEDQFSSSEIDPRYLRCTTYLNVAQYLRPHLPLLHGLGADVSEEDIFVTGIIFRSIIYGLMFPCTEYMKWLGEVDHTPAYEMLKLTLQVLQWQDVQMGRPRRCWLLKSPDHSFSLPSLRKVFPDAKIIQTHRDMSAVLPSYLNLVVYIHGIFIQVVDLKWTAEWWTAWFKYTLDRFVEDQKSIKGYVIDVLFSDLVSNDLTVVLHILSCLGVPVDEETKRTLKTYVLQHRRHSKGRILYQGGIFGLKKQEVKDSFKLYHEAFGLIKD
eukprot:g5653.t1